MPSVVGDRLEQKLERVHQHLQMVVGATAPSDKLPCCGAPWLGWLGIDATALSTSVSFVNASGHKKGNMQNNFHARFSISSSWDLTASCLAQVPCDL